MEDTIPEGRTTLLSRLVGKFVRTDEEGGYEEEDVEITSHSVSTGPAPLRAAPRYTVTLRKEIRDFDEVIAAAHGLKRGEQQILNLSHCEPAVRQKIVDFMSGVNFAEGGTWEEVGTDIYLICPVHAFLEVSPANARMTSGKN